MNYAIVYSSKTGNTARLAQTIRDTLGEKDCLYFGAPDPAAAEAGLLFVGFWTDKGQADEELTAFLKGLRGKRVFLFGTAGFGGSQPYFDQILDRVQAALDPSNRVVGRYMCQGRMPAPVRARYQAMAAQDPAKWQPMIDNFDRALSHPDETDLAALGRAVAELAV